MALPGFVWPGEFSPGPIGSDDCPWDPREPWNHTKTPAKMGGVNGQLNTDYHTFNKIMSALEDWYVDSQKARAYDSDPGHGASTPGHRVLHAGRYPGPNWRKAWYEADGDPVAEAAIIAAVEEELYGLDHGPSQSGPASGLHRGTKEWTLAVASADGSLRAVARRFGISHTEVRRQRLAHPELRDQ